MTIPSSRLAYNDCFEVMEQAAARPLRVTLETHSDAMQFRLRFHKARRLDREANLDIYPPSHPLHGCSAYDDLVLEWETDEATGKPKPNVFIISKRQPPIIEPLDERPPRPMVSSKPAPTGNGHLDPDQPLGSQGPGPTPLPSPSPGPRRRRIPQTDS